MNLVLNVYLRLFTDTYCHTGENGHPSTDKTPLGADVFPCVRGTSKIFRRTGISFEITAVIKGHLSRVGR